MSQKAWLDVLGSERLVEQRVGQQLVARQGTLAWRGSDGHGVLIHSHCGVPKVGSNPQPDPRCARMALWRDARTFGIRKTYT